MSSTTGAITFRTGNVFANQDTEQLRITPEGKVGIGTKAPETTLDVAGTIKARGGIQFEDQAFSTASSRTTKENFVMVDGAEVLSRLKGIDVSTWNYISEGRNVRHMGPMAEDFFKAFQLGAGNTSIGVQDLTGVSLAAIKALNQRADELQQKTAEVDHLRDEVNQLRNANSEMERRLATLEQLLMGQVQVTQTPKLH